MPEEDRIVIPDLQRIGKYDILERIADGGFATLYRGRDPFLKRLVAIKVCASEDLELRQQFLREAEIAGNLDHPSIVRTFDFGFDPVGPYLVQEYLRGEDLSQLIAEQAPLSVRRRLELLVQIAEGLAYSHGHLVLHLDIKPGNVRVIGRRHAKILDYGIARLATHDAAPPPSGMIGTAGYLPPEQVMGKVVDGRSDVFGFGALAYELLTFCRPFTGGSIPELIKRVLGAEAEPMKRYWPECSDALANLVGRCLRRDPAARYPSFDALLPELISIRDSFPDLPEVSSAATTKETGAAVVSPPLSSAPHSPTVAAQAKDAPRSKVALYAGLAAAAVVVAIALVAFLPPGSPIATPVLADVPVPVLASPPHPAPGVAVITALPWGRVTRVTAADGSAAELPENRVTPLRLWLPPGLHRAEVAVAGGAIAICSVDVTAGGVHPCQAAAADAPAGIDDTDYFKEMGWWQ